MKYKMLVDQALHNSDEVLHKDDVIEASEPVAAAGGAFDTKYQYRMRDGKIATQGLRIGTQVSPVDSAVNTQINTSAPTDAFSMLKAGAKRAQVLSTIGAVGGLFYAYKKGSSVGGYIGYALLFSFAGSVVALASVKIFPPKQ